MKLLCKKVLTNLAGEEMKMPDGDQATLGRTIANLLITGNGGVDSMKLFTLAQKLYSGDEVELDNADLSLIRKTIEKDKAHNTLVVGQVLSMLEDPEVCVK